MNIPHMIITQTPGQISINVQPGKMEMEQPPAQIDMNHHQPEENIDYVPSDLQIDQSRALAAYGSMTPMEMNDRIYAHIPEIVGEIIANIAQEGTRMANVHEEGNIIADLAKEPPRRMRELHFISPANVNNVDVRYTPGEVHIDVPKWQVDIDVEAQDPIFKHTPAQVHIGMQQYPSIDIEWVGKNVNRTI